jgi:hypothetical protein
MTGYGLDGRGVWVRIWVEAIVILFSTLSRPVLEIYAVCYVQGIISFEVKRPGHEADNFLQLVLK